MRRILGSLMCATPFIGFLVMAIQQEGWRFAVFLFGCVCGLMAWMAIALWVLLAE